MKQYPDKTNRFADSPGLIAFKIVSSSPPEWKKTIVFTLQTQLDKDAEVCRSE